MSASVPVRRGRRNPLQSPLLLLGLALAPPLALAQLPPGTSDASSTAQPQQQDPLRSEAASALGRGDFPTALKLLDQLAAKYPNDPHVLFDQASAQDALDQTSAAEATYRLAILADPTYFEPHLALGLLLARNHREPEARTTLQTATTLTTSDPALKARAFRALAHVDLTQNPAEARDALLAALKLSPETPDDMILSAELAEQAQDLPAAEAAYKRLLARTPNDPAVTASYARLLAKDGQAAGAETLLTSALAAHPDDPTLTAQLATLEMQQGKSAEATALLQKLHAAYPDNAAVTRMDARLLSQSGQYDRSEPLFAALASSQPGDPALLDDQADALIHLKRFPEAQKLLERAIQQPSAFSSREDFAACASHLAFAATQNNDPNTVLRALDLRATVLPQSPSSLFLAAAAHDKLHQVKQASDDYKQFLSVAKNQFPDEEWEARHRLIALEHMK